MTPIPFAMITTEQVIYQLSARIRWGFANGYDIEVWNAPPALAEDVVEHLSAELPPPATPPIQSRTWTIRGRYADGSSALSWTTLPS